MAKTIVGELAATDHCRSVVAELEALDKDFTALWEQKPGLPMPNWDVMRDAMPDWETLHHLYEKSKGPTQK